MTNIERMDELLRKHGSKGGFWSLNVHVVRLSIPPMKASADAVMWRTGSGDNVSGNGETITEAIDDLERQLNHAAPHVDEIEADLQIV